MVHLETKYSYLTEINQSPQIKSMVDQILFDIPVPISDLRNDASQVALNLILCVKANDKLQAESIYNQFAKRKPTKETHWIFDEFVVFAIVCAVRKFSFDPLWIREIIQLTSQTKDLASQMINETFRNVLTGNLNVNDDYHQISLVYQYLSKDENYKEERVNKMFTNLWRNNFPFYDSTFLNIISLKAIEISFSIKGLLNPQDYFNNQYFVNRFRKRITLGSKACSWVILLFTSALLYYLLWEANIVNEKLTNFIISATGLGVAVIFGLRKKIQEVFTTLLQSLFGYKSIKTSSDHANQPNPPLSN